jgi:hypothetical protein
MNRRFSNPAGNTRVSRVQCGVPPDCGEARGLVATRSIHQRWSVQPVSGETPETTRRGRVLPARRKTFHHA